MIVLRKRELYQHIWPIDEKAKKPPEGWSGWPGQKQFALVLHHDVDTAGGHEKCHHLMELEEKMGFRSSFNFVPERYNVSSELRHLLVAKGFEVGVHGLKHDGKLFSSRKTFEKQAVRINHYLKDWKSVGFVSPSMHNNLDWISRLDIKHDCSTFDTDPFEPKPDGIGTIFPFWVPRNNSSNPSNPMNSNNPMDSSNLDPLSINLSPSSSNQNDPMRSALCAMRYSDGFIELPYTLPQDFTLFVLMKERNIDIWKKKLDWIVDKGGMALLITHPDYMNCKKGRCKMDEYPMEFYEEFLDYIKSKYEGQYWHALPREMARFWKENFQTKEEMIPEIGE
ncbi:MAG: hypothetical protein A2Y97_13365 [Nitrospirae bacterium RBG_13_39_12]|nr:MAG: hypothetical protein A2Y97_13365 [Nitrospirae bacterium RBG_13_39_12]